ncbi:MAG: hypothetical protein ACR2KZ_15580, partial [Segetibacter sp.]
YRVSSHNPKANQLSTPKRRSECAGMTEDRFVGEGVRLTRNDCLKRGQYGPEFYGEKISLKWGQF